MSNTQIILLRSDVIRRDRIRKYRVILDGSLIGRIKAGSTESFDVEPGSHTLQLKIDWTGSSEVAFDIVEGETLRFDCEPNVGSGALADLGSSVGDSQKWITLVREK